MFAEVSSVQTMVIGSGVMLIGVLFGAALAWAGISIERKMEKEDERDGTTEDSGGTSGD